MNESTIDSQEVLKFKQHSKKWWDENGPLKTLHDINPARLQFIEKHLSLKGKSVLDVGCGGGILTEAIAKEGALCFGIDVEEEAINTAEKHAKEHSLNITYESIAIENFNKEDYFDIICCMELLEHVKDPQEIIRQCHRKLKPGGWLFLSTLNRTFKSYATAILAAEYILKILPKQTHDYNKFITPGELARALRRCGFEIEDIKGLNYNPFTRKSSLYDDVSVNYLIACRKIESLAE